MTIVNPPQFLQAGSYTAQNDRLQNLSAKFMPGDSFNFRGRGGLLSYAMDASYVINVSPTWSMTVGPFSWLVENDFATNGGDYFVVKTGNDVLTFTPSSPTLNRIDTIAVQVVDAFYSGAASEGRLVVIQGTATAGTAVAPTLPSSCEAIVDVSIPAGSTGLGTLSDRRRRSALIGAIMPISGTQFAESGLHSGETQYYEALGTYRTWRGGATNAWRAFGGMLARSGAQLATSWTVPTGQEANVSQVALNDPGGIWAALVSMQMEYTWSPAEARVDLDVSRNGINNSTQFATSLPLVSNPIFPVSFCQLSGGLSGVLTGPQTMWFNVYRTFGNTTTVTATAFNYRASAVQMLLRAP